MKKELTQAAQTAAAIRKELKENFPTTKFSVTSDNFSMGNSVDIRYTDGPTAKRVEELTNKYQYGHFNGMEDMYENTNSRDDIPQAKYVMVSREKSEAARNRIIDDIKKNQYPDFDENTMYGSYWGSSLIHQEFAKLDLEEKQDEPNFIAPKTEAGTVQIIEYSDKAIAVIGDTKPIKDKLKELGGKFNFRLTCGAGWIFPKTKLQALTAALSN